MYPYNTKSTLYQKSTSSNNQTKTSNMNENLNTRESHGMYQALKYDQRLLELLGIAFQEAKESAVVFQQLMEMDALKKDQNILRNAYLDELKHQKLLREIYYQISGKSLPTAEMKEKEKELILKKNFPSSNKLEETLESILLDELENADFHRELLSFIPDSEVKDMLMEIIIDKQDHSIRIGYLYSKYK